MLTIGFNIALGTQEVQMYIKEEEVKKEKKKVSPPKKKEKKVTPNRSITSRYENVHTPSSYDTLSKEEIGKDGVDVTK